MEQQYYSHSIAFIPSMSPLQSQITYLRRTYRPEPGWILRNCQLYPFVVRSESLIFFPTSAHSDNNLEMDEVQPPTFSHQRVRLQVSIYLICSLLKCPTSIFSRMALISVPRPTTTTPHWETNAVLSSVSCPKFGYAIGRYHQCWDER